MKSVRQNSCIIQRFRTVKAETVRRSMEVSRRVCAALRACRGSCRCDWQIHSSLLSGSRTPRQSYSQSAPAGAPNTDNGSFLPATCLHIDRVDRNNVFTCAWRHAWPDICPPPDMCHYASTCFGDPWGTQGWVELVSLCSKVRRSGVPVVRLGPNSITSICCGFGNHHPGHLPLLKVGIRVIGHWVTA